MIEYRRSLNHMPTRDRRPVPFIGPLGTLREIKVFGVLGSMVARLAGGRAPPELGAA